MKHESIVAACDECQVVADDFKVLLDVLKYTEVGAKILRALAIDIVAVLRWCDSIEQVVKYPNAYESAPNKNDLLAGFNENITKMQEIIEKAYYYVGSIA